MKWTEKHLEELLNGNGNNLGSRLIEAKKALNLLVQEANGFLEKSLIAKELGVNFVVSSTGEITKKERLPSIKELRALASKRGIDISHLGTKRRAIYDLLTAEDQPGVHPDEVFVSARELPSLKSSIKKSE